MLGMPRRHTPAALVALLLTGTALVACSRGKGPDPVLTAFLDGWRSGNLNAVGFVTADGQGVPAATVAEEIKTLSGDLAKKPPTLRVARKPKVNKNVADAEISVSWPVASGVTWDYPSPVRLAEDNGSWRLIWSAAVVHPQLTSGDQLNLRAKVADRGSILDGAGNALVQPRPVVDIGVEKQRITNITTLIAQLDAAFKSIGQTVDMSGLPQQVTNASPTQFIPLITLRREVYEQIRAKVQPLEGTAFIERSLELAPSREFARALLGSVDDVTREIMDKNPGKYAIGDQVGQGGLQEKFDDRLRGTPGLTIVRARKAADGTVNDADLWQSPPKAGQPLKTTLDPKVQNAADRALAAMPKPSALVAIRISDGAILAVANGPGAQGVNTAFNAQVPPGSTFKMVSALGLLDKGAVTLDGVVNCPQTINIGGANFKNAHDFSLGAVPFRQDFARSCNTAFASLGEKLGDTGLSDAAKSLGIGVKWDLGIDAFTGSVGTGGSAVDKAAAAFGQGRTQVSPLALASAAAAVQRGQWTQPKLVLDPAPAQAAPAGPQLKASTVEPLRQMMREVVQYGTGTALSKVAGGPVYGKTGTAEYDNNPAHTHAWWVGWQGDIAFAVFVQDGGDSTGASVPLAAAFLSNLQK